MNEKEAEIAEEEFGLVPTSVDTTSYQTIMFHALKRESNSQLYQQREDSVKLTQSLLNTISVSVQSFRPSQSLAHLAAVNEARHHTEIEKTEIDIVISGGGFKGLFMAGAAHVLMHSSLSKRELVVKRIAGASAGAWSGLFILCGFELHQWITTYYACKDRPSSTVHEVYHDLVPWVLGHMPPDAYIMCSGRLFVSITVLTATGLKNRIISEFSSNSDLIDCCMASSALPYLTERGLYRSYRGMAVMDGCLTNNTPVFADGTRRQLVFRLFDVEYPWRLLINPVDSCIEALVVRGAMLMARFLEGGYVESIAWLEKSDGGVAGVRQALAMSVRGRQAHWIRVGIIAPISLAVIMLYRGTGLRGLLAGTGGDGSRAAAAAVVQFRDAATVFSSNGGFQYLLGAAFAAVVDSLRSINVLL